MDGRAANEKFDGSSSSALLPTCVDKVDEEGGE